MTDDTPTPDNLVERLRSLAAYYESHPGTVETLTAAAAEIERLRAELDEAQLASIEARNPGIDMDEVKRLRKRTQDQEPGT